MILLLHRRHEKSLGKKMTEKYETQRASRGFSVVHIKEKFVRITIQILACSLFWKSFQDQVYASIIALATQCMEGVHMNWLVFLLDKFLEDYHETQEKGKPFLYTWLLICIALFGWKEPKYIQLFDKNRNPFLAARYENLWFTSS